MTKAKKKAARKRSTKPADGEIAAKRAKAYLEMEPHLCSVVNMIDIAVLCANSNHHFLTEFMVCRLSEALQSLKANYYATAFQE
jgi:hypothetical protein